MGKRGAGDALWLGVAIIGAWLFLPKIVAMIKGNGSGDSGSGGGILTYDQYMDAARTNLDTTNNSGGYNPYLGLDSYLEGFLLNIFGMDSYRTYRTTATTPKDNGNYTTYVSQYQKNTGVKPYLTVLPKAGQTGSISVFPTKMDYVNAVNYATKTNSAVSMAISSAQVGRNTALTEADKRAITTSVYLQQAGGRFGR